MGLLDSLRLARTQARYEAAIQAAHTTPYVEDPSTYPIVSPWASNDLQRIVFEDVFGTTVPRNDRASAMQIPAVWRARNIMTTAIAQNPLQALRGDTPVATQPSWLLSAPDGTSPQQRIVWTVDDLIFYGWSAWWRENGSDGFPIAVHRIPRGDWTITDDGHVEIRGTIARPENVIVFNGIHEGILSASDALRDVKTLYDNVRRRLCNPTPGLNLQQQETGKDLTDPEIDALIARWAAARRGENGGVSYTSKHLRPEPINGDGDASLMIESRNAAAVDMARLVGVSASLIDATAPKASLNYETTENRNAELVERDLALYMLPVAWRLSLDDVSPHGQRITFDTTDFTSPARPGTGPTFQD